MKPPWSPSPEDNRFFLSVEVQAEPYSFLQINYVTHQSDPHLDPASTQTGLELLCHLSWVVLRWSMRSLWRSG